jgi:hypothetical protein
MSTSAVSVIADNPIGPTDPACVEMMRFDSGLLDQAI